MTTPPLNISVIDPVGRALDRVKLVLFQPFDLGKWFVIGFCAWLAFLGEGGGGGGPHFNFPSGGSRHGHSARHELERAWDFIVGNLYWIIPLVAALVVLGFVLWVVFTWLSSRGRFMFLHCVALNQAQVVEPWGQYSREGNSLFLFRIVLGLISMVLILPLVVVGVVVGWRLFMAGRPTVPGILGLVAVVLSVIVLAIVFALIENLTKDFVVPLMYVRRRRCRECWGELLGLLRAYPGEFILWLLFQIVLGLAIGVLVLVVIVLTCCCACCLLALPYLGTVLLLPVLVFERSYSLYYLAQFGPPYDAFKVAGSPPAFGSLPSGA